MYDIFKASIFIFAHFLPRHSWSIVIFFNTQQTRTVDYKNYKIGYSVAVNSIYFVFSNSGAEMQGVVINMSLTILKFRTL